MAYKLNKKWIEMRKHLNEHTVYGKYICEYKSAIIDMGENISDYCIPFTEKELQLLKDGGWDFDGPDENGNYTIDGDLTIWIEDA